MGLTPTAVPTARLGKGASYVALQLSQEIGQFGQSLKD